MKTIRFGIEIETIGQTRANVAQAIQTVVGGTVTHNGIPTCYDTYEVTSTDGRVWRVMADASLNAPNEFKTARLHLMANLKGSAAWKHGRPAAQAV